MGRQFSAQGSASTIIRSWPRWGRVSLFDEGSAFGDDDARSEGGALVPLIVASRYLFRAHQAFPEILEMPLGVLGVVEPDAAVSFRPQPCPRLRT